MELINRANNKIIQSGCEIYEEFGPATSTFAGIDCPFAWGPRWIAQKTNPPRARCTYIFTRLSHDYDTFLRKTRKKLSLPRLSLMNERKNGSLRLLDKKRKDAAIIQRAIKN